MRFLQPTFLWFALAGLATTRATASLNTVIPPNDHVNYLYFAVQLHSAEETGRSLSRRDLEQRARNVGDALGYHLVKRVGELDDYYLYAVPRTSAFGSHLQTREEEQAAQVRVVRRLTEVPHVAWAEQQIPKQRLFKRNPVPGVMAEPRAPPRVDDIRNELNIRDPGFSNQWHLVNTLNVGNDLNVTGVWAQGITGKNATVSFIDDGLDYESEDLAANFYAAGSYDFNTHDPLPKPRMIDDRHGTRCAGEVAAVRNDVCGVGVAYDAKVSGIRILSGPLTEVDEAEAINFDFHNNHIYSCSWGPLDNGQTMEAPPKIVKDAVKKGVTEGRNGLGSIFVFASGNGGNLNDNCNADGYTNSIYTVTVGALSRSNTHPAYSEACAAVMIVMYSSGGSNDAIYTTDWMFGHAEQRCTSQHGGTSAAAPLASGLYALVLQIRPDLTWRDIQHLTVQTAVPVMLDDTDWEYTAANRWYSHKFGYGKLDGYALVEGAKTYQKVGPQAEFITEPKAENVTIPQNQNGISSIITVSEADMKAVNMSRLEHVTVTVNIPHRHRGDIEIYLISPFGIRSQMIAARPSDRSSAGFVNWTMMTVKHWDEHPVGNWTLVVKDAANNLYTGEFLNWWMTLYGQTGYKETPGSPLQPFVTPTPSALPVTDPTDTPNTQPSMQVPPAPNGPTVISGSGGGAGTVVMTIGLCALFVGGTAGAVYMYRKKADSVQEQDYTFKVLNNEVDAAFGEEEEYLSYDEFPGTEGGAVRGNQNVIFAMADDDEDQYG
ncbi:peptidase S8/S53 domain-containing protein [Gaertneriomyces semiglobifer]|nr:peptidase S8/S53 domain-containing protein [Gaertneriomyces semiglobifer]